MFQSVYYERRKGNPDKGYFFLRDDEEGWKKFKYSPPVYELDEDGDYTTLFGKKCSRIYGKYDWNDPNILEKDINKELALLRDLYFEKDDIPSYHNIVYLDIEIELLGSLTPSYIQMAIAAITSISLIDVNTKQKICFIVDKDNKLEEVEEDGKLIIPCSNERELINKFLTKWREIDPTIVVGWNSDYFDMPYLYCRILNVFGYETANLLSPLKKVINRPSESQNPLTIAGIASLDYMRLTKKYILKEEPSYKLEDIGMKYAKMGKIEYEGNLDKLFKEDVHKFIDYNIRDVEIIEELEKNMKFLDLTILISHLCHTPYESIYYNTVLNEGAILTYLKRKDIIVHNRPTTYNPSIKEINIGDFVTNQRGEPSIDGEVINIDGDNIIVQLAGGDTRVRDIKSIRKKQSYAGGFLLNPKPGIYKWLSDYDYASLYPSIIRSLNLGIETLFGRLQIPNNTRNLWWGLSDMKMKDPNESIVIEILNLETYEFQPKQTTISKLIKFIEKNKLTVSPNGVMFRTDKRSIVADVLSDWFALRKQYKSKLHKFEPGSAEYKLYDSQQLSFKILLNAVYGAFAINGWRFTDGYKTLSSAITTCGQRMTIETIRYANEVIDEKWINSD
jgi:DNA polymerase elongation subunit (family B)